MEFSVGSPREDKYHKLAVKTNGNPFQLNIDGVLLVVENGEAKLHTAGSSTGSNSPVLPVTSVFKTKESKWWTFSPLKAIIGVTIITLAGLVIARNSQE